MSRAEEFVALYNELDDFLRKQLSDRGTRVQSFEPFTSLLARVGEFNPTIRALQHDLQGMADLRNAIVHRYRHEVIAEPTQKVVTDLGNLVDKVLRPKRAHHISTKNLRLFDGDEELSDVLAHMKQHQYSQVVVWYSDGIHLLSSVGIAHWLEQQVPVSIVELTGVSLAALLEYEPRGSFNVTARNALADEIREMFLTPPGKASERLQAVVVTDSGRRDQQPLGIITPWDIVN